MQACTGTPQGWNLPHLPVPAGVSHVTNAPSHPQPQAAGATRSHIRSIFLTGRVSSKTHLRRFGHCPHRLDSKAKKEVALTALLEQAFACRHAACSPYRNMQRFGVGREGGSIKTLYFHSVIEGPRKVASNPPTPGRNTAEIK